MEAPRYVDERLFEGHYIYVRDRGTLDDSAFLSLLDLEGYQPDQSPKFPASYAHILRSGEWSAFADDWYYTVYNSPSVAHCVEKIAQRFEVLRTAVGDADDSFEIYHFAEGKELRSFYLDAWNKRPPEIVRDFGTPFACEESLKDEDPWKIIMAVASELGIDTLGLSENRTTYSKPRKQNKPAMDKPDPASSRLTLVDRIRKLFS